MKNGKGRVDSNILWRCSLRIIFILLSMASALLISSCSIIYHHYPFEEVRNIKTIEDKLSCSIANNKSISMMQIATVTYGDKYSPIWVYSYVPNSPKHYVLITAGIHGAVQPEHSTYIERSNET